MVPALPTPRENQIYTINLTKIGLLAPPPGIQLLFGSPSLKIVCKCAGIKINSKINDLITLCNAKITVCSVMYTILKQLLEFLVFYHLL